MSHHRIEGISGTVSHLAFSGIISFWLTYQFPGTASEIWGEIFCKNTFIKEKLSGSIVDNVFIPCELECGPLNKGAMLFLQKVPEDNKCRGRQTSQWHTNRHSDHFCLLLESFLITKIPQFTLRFVDLYLAAVSLFFLFFLPSFPSFSLFQTLSFFLVSEEAPVIKFGYVLQTSVAFVNQKIALPVARAKPTFRKIIWF